MRIGFPSKSENTIQKLSEMERGVIGLTKGKAILPNLETAVLAQLRGYRLGSYPKPLEGIAKKLGYHPIQTATPDEMRIIAGTVEEMRQTWNRS